jgi:hypothetical protein
LLKCDDKNASLQMCGTCGSGCSAWEWETTGYALLNGTELEVLFCFAVLRAHYASSARPFSYSAIPSCLSRPAQVLATVLSQVPCASVRLPVGIWRCVGVYSTSISHGLHIAHTTRAGRGSDMDDAQHLHHQKGHPAPQVDPSRPHSYLTPTPPAEFLHVCCVDDIQTNFLARRSAACSCASVCAQFDWWICIRRLDEMSKTDEKAAKPGMPKK